jgi:hypothetical protein
VKGDIKEMDILLCHPYSEYNKDFDAKAFKIKGEGLFMKKLLSSVLLASLVVFTLTGCS